MQPGAARAVQTGKLFLGGPLGRVSIGEVLREVCLEYVPGAGVGDFVLVQFEFALVVVDEEEAARAYDALEATEELDSSPDARLGGGDSV